jgi:hypothetical protein
MSQEHSGRVATPKAVKSRRRKSKKKSKPKKKAVPGAAKLVDFGPKVFDKPEFRLPFRLAALTRSRRSKYAVDPAPWLLAAVQSGLVEMVAPSEAIRGVGLLEPINGTHPPTGMIDGKTYEQILAEGMANTLKELENLK